MCGIVGLVDTKNRIFRTRCSTRCAMSCSIAVPTASGTFREGPVAMAMRRLSVIDLAHGWQPLYSRGDRVVAFQNGEIYNYRTLRSELESLPVSRSRRRATPRFWRTATRNGGSTDCWSASTGCTPIAILDRDRRELHLARDRFRGEAALLPVNAGPVRICLGPVRPCSVAVGGGGAGRSSIP